MYVWMNIKSNKDLSDLKFWKENSKFPKNEFTKERVIRLLEMLRLKIDW